MTGGSLSTAAPIRTSAELAWELIVSLAPHLNRPCRNRLFAAIGSGDTYPAIEELLAQAARGGYPLIESVAVEIERWLNGYSGTSGEPRLRAIVAQLKVVGPPSDPAGSPRAT